MLQASVDLIAAGEELGAGGSADWLHVVVFEAHSGGGNGIDVGRLDDVLFQRTALYMASNVYLPGGIQCRCIRNHQLSQKRYLVCQTRCFHILISLQKRVLRARKPRKSSFFDCFLLYMLMLLKTLELFVLRGKVRKIVKTGD